LAPLVPLLLTSALLVLFILPRLGLALGKQISYDFWNWLLMAQLPLALRRLILSSPM
jgi:hypothetical protein